jgi:hypothetical protein
MAFHAGFLPDVFFIPDDGGDVLLRNISWLSTDYTAFISQKIELFKHVT